MFQTPNESPAQVAEDPSEETGPNASLRAEMVTLLKHMEEEEKEKILKESISQRELLVIIGANREKVTDQEALARINAIEKELGVNDEELTEDDKSPEAELEDQDAKKENPPEPKLVVLPPKSERKEKGFGGKIKEFLFSPQGAMIGGLIKTYVSFMRNWHKWFPSENPEEQKRKLKNLDDMYEKFFGVSELKDTVVQYFERVGVKLNIVQDPAKDGKVRHDLRLEFMKKKREATKDMSAEEMEYYDNAHTFESFVNEYLEKQNIQSFIEDKDKTYATTLIGIRDRDIPVEWQEDEKEEESGDVKDTGNWFASLFFPSNKS